MNDFLGTQKKRPLIAGALWGRLSPLGSLLCLLCGLLLRGLLFLRYHNEGGKEVGRTSTTVYA